MPKSQRLKAYDRAFTAIVRARRKWGFPPWRTWQQVDADADKHIAPNGATWSDHMGTSEWSQMRAFIYLVNETWGPVPWENAHTVPTSGKVNHSDPIMPKKVRAEVPPASTPPPKKALPKKAGKALPPKRRP